MTDVAPTAAHHADNLSGWVTRLYAQEPLARRTLQKLRLYICPFEEILPHVAPKSTVLDIGCGSGLFLGLLSTIRKIERGIGIDVSAEAIGAADRMANRLEEWNTSASLDFIKTANRNSWPHERFDVVSMIDVAHHLRRVKQEDYVRNACRLVAPGGTFIYKDMAMRPRWMAFANRMHDLLLTGQWVHYLDIMRVERIARQEGLELITRKSMDRFCYAHELRVFVR